MGLFALVFFGESIFATFKMPVPEPLKAAQSNKFASFMFLWLIGNMVQSSLISTGAFEIHHGDKLIWSSLEEKRLPNMEDLIQAFNTTGVEFMQTHRDGV